MRLRRALARAYWRLSRWSPDPTQPPAEGRGILLGAPHTSNWDFVLMLALSWQWGVNVRWLGKNSLFKRPFGPLMRALGGIPVQREDPSGLVDELVAQVRTGPTYLVITPEGSRSATPYWKSGFYRIARATGMTVTLGYVDRRSMTAGLGPTLTMTGDVRADMDKVRAFYAGKVGVRGGPERVPRLHAEEE
ncbi:1-acyl-sn-glycerol-3-phosphate acyltransferase [Oceanitalea stevensii]|uniref:1-acyl-sn-glycerol-3-phosphate acyltransferase n=1 Tax=Oceanitalea stevensii TaxID=2763072 RepID=A0ABR8Z3T2_9MICO|nr:1-acyl-sn-glycerol-3-phosphate acyltransferase [Oceanitalea stevensii]MBD8062837.1 1-acyl-sn-glycerol-3-phosphate acyltransferase [Oceanitalea stevensii]